jgi:hypothetical protein
LVFGAAFLLGLAPDGGWRSIVSLELAGVALWAEIAVYDFTRDCSVRGVPGRLVAVVTVFALGGWLVEAVAGLFAREKVRRVCRP